MRTFRISNFFFSIFNSNISTQNMIYCRKHEMKKQIRKKKTLQKWFFIIKISYSNYLLRCLSSEKSRNKEKSGYFVSICEYVKACKCEREGGKKKIKSITGPKKMMMTPATVKKCSCDHKTFLYFLFFNGITRKSIKKRVYFWNIVMM